MTREQAWERYRERYRVALRVAWRRHLHHEGTSPYCDTVLNVANVRERAQLARDLAVA